MAAAIAPRILIVEDDDELRQALSRSVAALGARAQPARDGLEALRILGAEETPPEAILLDMSLPRGEGEALLDRLRSDPALASVPVITISEGAAPRPRRAVRAVDGCDAHDVARILVSLCHREGRGLPAPKPA